VHECIKQGSHFCTVCRPWITDRMASVPLRRHLVNNRAFLEVTQSLTDCVAFSTDNTSMPFAWSSEKNAAEESQWATVLSTNFEQLATGIREDKVPHEWLHHELLRQLQGNMSNFALRRLVNKSPRQLVQNSTPDLRRFLQRHNGVTLCAHDQRQPLQR
jgi:hypothetical protein